MYLFRKITIITSIVISSLLVSCQVTSQWRCQKIRTLDACDCIRVTYRSENPSNGIDLEFLRTEEGVISYLQVHSAPISSKEERAKLKISSDSSSFTYLLPLHKGNQRIRLDKEVQEKLITLLYQKKPITLNLGTYSETINPHPFEKVYEQIR